MMSENKMNKEIEEKRLENITGGAGTGHVWYEISPADCVECGQCADNCMCGCIEAVDGGKFRIVQEECIGCGNCYNICPTETIIEHRE